MPYLVKVSHTVIDFKCPYCGIGLQIEEHSSDCSFEDNEGEDDGYCDNCDHYLKVQRDNNNLDHKVRKSLKNEHS